VAPSLVKSVKKAFIIPKRIMNIPKGDMNADTIVPRTDDASMSKAMNVKPANIRKNPPDFFFEKYPTRKKTEKKIKKKAMENWFMFFPSS
jgi:hypothetical protein